MGTEAERQDTRKAMAFDLCNIIDEDPSQETYTKEEIKRSYGCMSPRRTRSKPDHKKEA